MDFELDVEAISIMLASLPAEVEATIELCCENCGETSTDVRPGFDPYAEEINGIEVWVLYCPNCFHESAMDI